MVAIASSSIMSPQAPPAVEEFLEFDLPETNHASPASSSSCDTRKSNKTTGGIGVAARKRGVHSDQGINFQTGLMTPPEYISRANSQDLTSSRRRRKHKDGASTGIRSPQVGSDLLHRALQKTCVSVRSHFYYLRVILSRKIVSKKIFASFCFKNSPLNSKFEYFFKTQASRRSSISQSSIHDAMDFSRSPGVQELIAKFQFLSSVAF